ncbi:PKD domain-containing protein [Chitinophagaceae bacterium MMS25-I14]
MNRFLYTVMCIGLAICLPLITKAQLTAQFSANLTSSCSPVLINFTDQSTGGPTSWTWDLGNGTTSTQQNPSATYFAVGTYTVTLTVSNGTTTSSVQHNITVIPTPVVSFVASDSTASCAPKAVTFTNTSVPGTTGAATYSWDFGDGGFSSAVSPAHTYTTSGVYNVTLVVTNSSGCVASITKPSYINILPNPHANFTSANATGCTVPATVTFNNTSTGSTIYQWNFGDGGTSTSASPSHTYNAAGTYTVRLIASNGSCSDTMTKTAFVNIAPVTAGFTAPGTGCVGQGVAFTNTSSASATTYTWSFGDGGTSTAANPAHAYAAGGTYTVKLVSGNGSCSDSITKTVTINPKPTAQFSANNTVGCTTPLSVTFTNTSSGATSYTWDFGDGGTSTAAAPTHSYNSLGVFTVRLIATNASGCSDTLTMPNYINNGTPSSAIGASYSSSCIPASVTFTLFAGSLSISSISWTFGDGSPNSTSLNPTHVYLTAGTFIVYATITTTSGCVFNTPAQAVVTNVKPHASFGATPTVICPNSPVQFQDSSTGTITGYTWLFGDGGTSSQQNPSYSYNTPGTYSVSLVVSNNGCLDTLTRTNLIVVRPPKAKFTFSVNCVTRKSVTFTNISDSAQTSFWDFGDGTTSSATNPPIHTYAANGDYPVKLTVTNATYGCTDTTTKIVHIFDLVSQFSSPDTSVCKGLSSTFTATVTNPYYTSYSWNFGDGTPAQTGSTITHTYAATGTYSVTLTVTDIYGCTVALTKNNYVRVKGPAVSFTNTPSVGCLSTVVTFTNNTTSLATVNNYTWRFGDGATLTQPGFTASTQHTYIAAGTYNVTLTATDVNGCKDSATISNAVSIIKPTAGFTATTTTACLGTPVTFVNSSTGGTSYLWDFGDGSPAVSTTSTANISHSYTANGTYTVRLVVTGNGSCTDTLTRTSYIQISSVKALFTASDTVANCPPLTVNFTNTSTGATAYAWSFGNGGTSSQVNAATVYTMPGTYTVKLIATNAIGCIDSFKKNIVINGPTGSFSMTPLVGCSPLTVNFTATTNNTQYIIWDFDNGVTQTTTTNTLSYTYTTAGIYKPKLILSNGTGCQIPLYGVDTVKVDGISADFTFTPNNVCQPGIITFKDTIYSSVTTVGTPTWIFGDGSPSVTAHNPVHTYVTSGTFTVKMALNNGNNCKDTISHIVTILPVPVVSVSPNQTICNGSSVTLTATSSGTPVTYSWSPATGLSSTTVANPTANPTTTTTYTVTGTTSGGCTASASVTVTVNPVPVINAGIDTAVCTGGSVQLTATGAGAGGTYSWTPATGLSSTTVANPVSTPSSTTTYVVTGTTSGANGCSAKDTIVVTVKPLPTISAGSNVTICVGSSTTLQATGGVSYVWSPATGLSSTTVANPTATPSATTIYTVTGTGANGCVNTSQVTVTVTTSPTVSIAGNTTICNGSSTVLTASGANTYVWSPATGLSSTTVANPTANPTTTTTYTVTGTAAGGCTGTTTVTVTVNPVPVINAGIDTAVCTGGSVQLIATGAGTGGTYSWTPATGLSSTTVANPVSTPSSTTTYVVTGTTSGANGCSAKDTVVVTVKPLPTISAGTNITICAGTSTTLQATGGVSYVWSPATGLSSTTVANPTANPSVTTTYTVTGTGANGCVNTSQVTVTVTTNPTISVAGGTTICKGSSTVLTASGANTYVWSPATGLSSTTVANPTANPTTTTTYTVTGTASGGCSGSTTVTVTVNPLPVINAGIDTAVCSGGSVQLTATGAGTGGTYSWTPATGLSSTTVANPVATPTATTSYIVTGTTSGANGCSAKDTVVVTVKPLPTISAGTNTTICAGTSTTLQATGGVSYVWSPATGLSSTTADNPTANPSATTTYTVTGTGANGCVNTSQVTVTVTTNPTISVAGGTTICKGSSTVLTASGANTYVWSPATGLSSTTVANPTANPTTTTTYTVTGTASGGCSGSTTVTVTVNPLPVINAGIDTAVCSGGSVQLTATGAGTGGTYSWTPATGLSSTTIANPVATPTATTSYIVTGTTSGANGCSAKDTVVVTVKPLPTISAGSNVSICKSTSTTLQATGGVSYVWSPATGLSSTTIANPVASPTTATTYTVTGTGANGCTNTSQVTVSIYAQPVISAGPNQNLCLGSYTTLVATGASSYVWTPATGLSNPNIYNPVATPATTTTYTIKGTDSHGCVDSGTITVTVNPLPVISAGSNVSICKGSSTQLQATGGVSYVWSPNVGLSSATAANPTASPTATTTYTVTGTAASGCSSTSQVTVTVKPQPQVSAGGNLSICKGNSVQLNATGAASFTWSPATGLSCVSCANPIATPTASSTTYTVTGTDTAGCSNTATVTVNFYTAPAISAGKDQTICAGSSAQLQATGGVTYTWTPAATLSCTACPDPLATPVANTTYQVVGIDANGCKDSASVNISLIQHVPTSVGPGDTLCDGGSAQLHASGGQQYMWLPSAGLNDYTSANPVASPSVTTTYMVLIKENQCFTDTDYVTVVVHPQPTVNAGPDLGVPAGSSVQLTPTITNATIYQWTPATDLSCADCANPIAAPAHTTTYTIKVSNEFGCTAEDDVLLVVKCDNSQLFIPNTFTPNGDGQNDIFYPHAKGISTIRRLRVYDRWGEVVFDAQNFPANDASYGWNGTFKGEVLNPDTFIYILEATCISGEPLQLKGDVSLVR